MLIHAVGLNVFRVLTFMSITVYIVQWMIQILEKDDWQGYDVKLLLGISVVNPHSVIDSIGSQFVLKWLK